MCFWAPFSLPRASKTDPPGRSGPRNPIPRPRASWPPRCLEIGPPGTRIVIEATWCKHASSNLSLGHTFAHAPRNLSDGRGVLRKSASVPNCKKKIGQSSPLPEGSIPATGNRSIDDSTDTPENPGAKKNGPEFPPARRQLTRYGNKSMDDCTETPHRLALRNLSGVLVILFLSPQTLSKTIS